MLNKKIKRLIVPFSLVALITIPSLASAEDGENNTGALLNDPSLTKSEVNDLVELAAEKDAQLEEELEKTQKSGEFGILADPDGLYYTISATGYKQETGYWCGPASGRQSLSFHKTKSGSSTGLPSQTTLASKMGTTTAGSTTTGIANGLNAYKSSFGFTGNPYVAADITNVSNPQATFETRIKGVLSKKTNAPVILIETKYLPRYNGHAIRHYNTVTGYSHDYNTGSKRVRTADPHFSSSYYGTYWNPLGTTSANGVFRAVYMADKNGTNMAMAY